MVYLFFRFAGRFRVVAGLIMALFLSGCSRGNGSHVATVSWLPKSASDISYHDDGSLLFSGITFECTMSPEDFQSFAKQRRWKPVEQRDFYCSINRHALGLPPFNMEESGVTNHYAVALVYEDIAANNGGIRVIYDPARRRLLVDDSSH